MSIGLTLRESTSAEQREPYRRGAPNVVLIVLDDLGFGQLGCDAGPPKQERIDEIIQTVMRHQ